MKANHNFLIADGVKEISIYNIQKNNNWKQITTINAMTIDRKQVFTIFKRTIIESKSQHGLVKEITYTKYLQYSKEQ